MYAAANGHLRTLRVLIAAGADVNLTNHAGRTALWFARAYRNPRAIELLIEAGAIE
jgi:ankyrin repeat protein